jgi:hypothetical protein
MIEPESRASKSQPLPFATTTTGASLASRVWHSIVRDMIIRAKTWTAKYGVLPNVCEFKRPFIFTDFLRAVSLPFFPA